MTNPGHPLSAHSSATLHEALGQIGALPAAIKPLHRTMRVCGPAFPLESAPKDNLALHWALAEAPSGSVLVVDAKGESEAGPWGEVMTVAAQARGIAGLVIYGTVRDSSEIIELGFPVFSTGLSIKGTAKNHRGEMPAAVTIGGITVNPGDMVVGDADGVVIIPRDRIDEAPGLADARVKKEAEIMQELRSGKLTLDLLKLR